MSLSDLAQFPNSVVREEWLAGFLGSTSRPALARDLAADGLHIVLNAGDGQFMPSGNFTVSIDAETILVFSRDKDTLQMLADGRGYGETAATTHAAGSAVQTSEIEGRVRLAAELLAVQNYLGPQGESIGTPFGDLGLNGVTTGFTLDISETLVPALTTGVLYAHGRRIAPLADPPVPAAPDDTTSNLFFSYFQGFYYSSDVFGNSADDAYIGQVVAASGAIASVVQSTKLFGSIAYSLSGSSNASIPHLLGRVPVGAIIQPESANAPVWQSSAHYDNTNLLVTATGTGTGLIQVW